MSSLPPIVQPTLQMPSLPSQTQVDMGTAGDSGSATSIATSLKSMSAITPLAASASSANLQGVLDAPPLTDAHWQHLITTNIAEAAAKTGLMLRPTGPKEKAPEREARIDVNQQRSFQLLDGLASSLVSTKETLAADIETAVKLIGDNGQALGTTIRSVEENHRFLMAFIMEATKRINNLEDKSAASSVTAGNGNVFSIVEDPTYRLLHEKVHEISEFSQSVANSLKDVADAVNTQATSLAGLTRDVKSLMQPPLPTITTPVSKHTWAPLASPVAFQPNALSAPGNTIVPAFLGVSQGPSQLNAAGAEPLRKRPRMDVDIASNSGYTTVQVGYFEAKGRAVDAVSHLIQHSQGFHFGETAQPSRWEEKSEGGILTMTFKQRSRAEDWCNMVNGSSSPIFARRGATVVGTAASITPAFLGLYDCVASEMNFVEPLSPCLRSVVPPPHPSVSPVLPLPLSREKEPIMVIPMSVSLTDKPCPCQIGYWNIQGALGLKIRKKSVRDWIEKHSVTFFGETWCSPGESSRIPLPKGYDILEASRPTLGGRIGHGGIAVVVKDSLAHTVLHEHCKTDIIVLELHTVILVGAYICPESSRWRKWTDTEPKIQLTETVALLRMLYPDKPVAVLADFNGRTGSEDGGLNRTSADVVTNGRGRWILETAGDNDLVVLNGTIYEANSPGQWTSFQPRGKAVVDYILWPVALLPNLMAGGLKVSQKLRMSDHAQMSLTYTPLTESPPPIPETPIIIPSVGSVEHDIRDAHPTWFRSHPELEALMASALDAAKPPLVRLQKLYGATCFDGKHSDFMITTVVAKSKVWALVAISQGLGEGARITTGTLPVNLPASTVSAGLWALLFCLSVCSPTHRAIVYTSDRGLIAAVGVQMVRAEDLGFISPSHGSTARVFVEIMRKRRAPLDLRLSTTDVQIAEQCSLRRQVMPLVDTIDCIAPLTIPALPVPPEGMLLPHSIKLLTPVATSPKTLPVSKPTRKAPTLVLAPLDDQRITKAVRELVVEWHTRYVSCQTSAEFWTCVRELTGEKTRSAAVTAGALRQSFYKRLNGIGAQISFFDENQRRRVERFLHAMPSRSVDHSENRTFSRGIHVNEIAAAKARIAKRPLTSAKGPDKVAYTTLLDVPNEILATLFTECLERTSAPADWLTTRLIGILKAGKNKISAESYRLIGLESCTLKLMTLVLENRLREFVIQTDIVPASQNGFTPKRRTNNNPFVLSCAIDKARSIGKPLMTLSVDLTNAFPSTDISLLWVKMYELGISGPVFDWLRMLYARMLYIVEDKEGVTEAFKSLVGVLTGDSASPILWNIYFADIEKYIPRHHVDIVLANVPVCHTEQADDALLYTTEGIALQEKADGFTRWTTVSFASVSAVKTEYITLGCAARSRADIRIHGRLIREVDFTKHVGIYFSTGSNVFQLHYVQKGKQARRVLNVLFSMERYIGHLSLRDALCLYRAQVDPHLTNGSDVCLDVRIASVQILERVQLAFLRRALALSSRCCMVPLFTETGMLPIRYRRLHLALDYLHYVALLPAAALPNAALRDSIVLLEAGKDCWVGRLRTVLAALPVPVVIHSWSLGNAQNPSWLKEIHAKVDDAYRIWFTREIAGNGRLAILQACPPRTFPGELPAYLKVQHPTHRRALTRLVFSEHPLAVEILRRGDHRRKRVSRERRLCRFCLIEVEDEVHALWRCSSSVELAELRDALLTNIAGEDEFTGRDLKAIVGLLHSEQWAGRFGSYVYDVFELFSTTDILVPTDHQGDDTMGTLVDEDRMLSYIGLG